MNVFSKLQVVSGLFMISTSVIMSYFVAAGSLSIIEALQNLTLLIVVFQMSWIDFREKLIPNRLVLLLLLARVLFLIVQAIQDWQGFHHVLLTVLLGLLIGGGIVTVALLVSKNGIGAGDAKMFAAIGAFLGWQGILNVLFLSFFLSAIVGLYLLFVKKVTMKTTIPLAPFALLGLFIHLVMQGVGNA